MSPSGSSSKAGAPGRIMVVNDTPGEECRIAILDQGKLDGLYTERVATATNVGNIYKGRVANVEPAIQAAFVDFGEGQSGFLHISDLHPRYFPSGEKTEKVGKKIPRRSRPLMQEALKRGSEILVQVLKEGIGTKGPTLTSYLSIPGRLLVMMPGMDRVGVSRKVEDEAQRREMRKILDALALPEGFGFILRTAGFTATKTDLSRDAAYLTRLWKVMERRIERVGAPCELYTESDLLLRSLRDLLDTSIEAVIVDSESALQRATQFLGVIAPRSSPPVRYYGGKAPIFHAFDVERQIEMIHAREVPLPSGGALVFDQTEALVAIDVNSGRSRSARDSETNAFQTNCEAVEEICRQLRLRDLGGLVIGDLIDMRSAKHRKEIEERFNQHFRKDRARTTVLPISDFGLVQITRQRMRPSLRKTHYSDCPACAGHGEIRLPESLAADALRRAGALLAHERVRRIELVVPVRVAAALLGPRRNQLGRLERLFDKRIDVRISEAIGIDRFDAYAYDDRNADIEIERLPALPMPDIAQLPTAAPPPEAEPDAEEEGTAAGGGGGGRRRRRRKPGPADAAAIALAGGFEPEEFDEIEEAGEAVAAEAPEGEGKEETPGEGGRRRRRRRRRRGRGGEAAIAEADATSHADAEAEAPAAPQGPTLPAELEGEGPFRVHLFAKALGMTSREFLDRCAAEGIEGVRSAMSSLSGDALATVKGWFAAEPPPAAAAEGKSPPEESSEDAAEAARESEGEGKRRRRRRRRRGRGGSGGEDAADSAAAAASSEPSEVAVVETMPPKADEADGDEEESGEAAGAVEGDAPRKKRRRRRRRGGGRSDGASGGEEGAATSAASPQPQPVAAAPDSPPAAPASPRPRSLYAGARSKKLPAVRRDDDR